MTPPALHFAILTPGPIEMRAGTVIDYRLSLSGLRFRWRTLIEIFEPEDRFVDVQTRGPYKLWRHRHEFRDVLGGTEIADRVEYELPFGVLGDVVHAAIVHRQLGRIFSYRRATIEGLFGKVG